MRAWVQSEHERYLTEVVFDKRPLIVTDYPKAIKAFYMRENTDGKTVAAMDVLVPKVSYEQGANSTHCETSTAAVQKLTFGRLGWCSGGRADGRLPA